MASRSIDALAYVADHAGCTDAACPVIDRGLIMAEESLRRDIRTVTGFQAFLLLFASILMGAEEVLKGFAIGLTGYWGGVLAMTIRCHGQFSKREAWFIRFAWLPILILGWIALGLVEDLWYR
jgi:hypothetical protein